MYKPVRIFPSKGPLNDCAHSWASALSHPLHFFVGFEAFLYFSIFYTGAVWLKTSCKQIEKGMGAAETPNACGDAMFKCALLACGSPCKAQKATREEECYSFIWHVFEYFLCVWCITIRQCQNRWDLWTKKNLRDHLRGREWEPGRWSAAAPGPYSLLEAKLGSNLVFWTQISWHTQYIFSCLSCRFLKCK